MKSNFEHLNSMSRDWLVRDVFPLWIKDGIDPQNKSFFETLSREGKPLQVNKRVMVQARQIYSFVEAYRLDILSKDETKKILAPAVDFFVQSYSRPSGGFIHAVDPVGNEVDSKMDLYAQAFSLFGLAVAYEVLREPRLKETAKKLISYLQSERAFKNGGYSELINGKWANEANPHMHLFEAAIAWMKVDSDSLWGDFAGGIAKLCGEKFIDKKTGLLCEHFDSDWTPLKEDGRYIWEPGHQHEWAWLFVQYAEASKTKVDPIAFKLFETAEELGRNPENGFAYDEVWNDGKIKKTSSRFWPQSERVKAAVSLGQLVPSGEQKKFAAAADEALQNLFKFFVGMKPGLWEDTRLENGSFTDQPIKSSSLYHIINAIAEYSRKRGQLQES